MAKDLRSRELAAIHIRKKELGLDEDAYRSVLREAAGVDSAAHLDARGRQAVLQRFRPRTQSAPRRRWGRTSADPQVRKVYALLGAADPPRPPGYALSILRRKYGASAPEAIEFATGAQLHFLIGALEVDRRRRAAR